MRCTKCRQPILQGQQRNIGDRLICEDCYMEMLSPKRPVLKCGEFRASSAFLKDWGMSGALDS